jgi:hypothetical protein
MTAREAPSTGASFGSFTSNPCCTAQDRRSERTQRGHPARDAHEREARDVLGVLRVDAHREERQPLHVATTRDERLRVVGLRVLDEVEDDRVGARVVQNDLKENARTIGDATQLRLRVEGVEVLDVAQRLRCSLGASRSSALPKWPNGRNAVFAPATKISSVTASSPCRSTPHFSGVMSASGCQPRAGQPR